MDEEETAFDHPNRDTSLSQSFDQLRESVEELKESFEQLPTPPSSGKKNSEFGKRYRFKNDFPEVDDDDDSPPSNFNEFLLAQR